MNAIFSCWCCCFGSGDRQLAAGEAVVANYHLYCSTDCIDQRQLESYYLFLFQCCYRHHHVWRSSRQLCICISCWQFEITRHSCRRYFCVALVQHHWLEWNKLLSQIQIDCFNKRYYFRFNTNCSMTKYCCCGFETICLNYHWKLKNADFDFAIVVVISCFTCLNQELQVLMNSTCSLRHRFRTVVAVAVVGCLWGFAVSSDLMNFTASFRCKNGPEG